MTYRRVLAGFGPGTAGERSRRYGAFVRAGVADPPDQPWRRAWGGAVVGSKEFYDGVKKRLGLAEAELEIPVSQALIDRPELEAVVLACATALKADRADWVSGRRDDGMRRALAAWLCRGVYGFKGIDIARALGYRDGGCVTRAAARVSESAELRKKGGRLEREVRRGLD